MAGVAPRYEIYAGGDPAGFVVAQNITRRHLNESQRALVAARLTNLQVGERADYRRANLRTLSPVSQPDAADKLNVSRRSVQAAKAVLEKADPAAASPSSRPPRRMRAVQNIELPSRSNATLHPCRPTTSSRSHDRVKRELKRAASSSAYRRRPGDAEWPSGRYPVI